MALFGGYCIEDGGAFVDWHCMAGSALDKSTYVPCGIALFAPWDEHWRGVQEQLHHF